MTNYLVHLRICLLICFGFLFRQLPAQDSLLIKFQNKNLPDTVRLKAIYQYARQMVMTNADSVSYYIAIAYRNFDFSGKLEPWYYKIAGVYGSALLFSGKFDSALVYHQKDLRYRSKKGDNAGRSRAMLNVGNVYMYMGDYPRSMEMFMSSLRLREKIGDKKGMADCYNNIANIFQLQGDLEKCSFYLLKAVPIYQEIGQIDGLINAYGNLGALYLATGKHAENLLYQRKAIELSKQEDNIYTLANSYGNIGKSFRALNQIDSALFYFNLSYQYHKQMGNPSHTSQSLANLGNTYLLVKQYALAEKNCLAAEKLANEINAHDDISVACQCLKEVYDKLGNKEKALYYFERYVAEQDSLMNEERAKEMARSETLYLYGKKAAADSVKAAEERKVSEARMEKEQTKRKIWFSGLGLVLLLIIVVLFGLIRLKRKNEIIRNQTKEIDAQKSILESQKDAIEIKQKEILDSITYARRIQLSLLPGEKRVLKMLQSAQSKGSK